MERGGAKWAIAVMLLCSHCAVPDESTSTAVTPLPDYIWYVDPEPGKTYTQDEWESLGTWWADAISSGICVSLKPSPLMEPGDFYTAEGWLQRVHIAVDGTMITEYDELVLTDSLGDEMIDRETGEVIWREPGGVPLLVCYEMSLQRGQHTAEIFVERTSGEQVSYAWSFTITR